jgi:hypothetical protein
MAEHSIVTARPRTGHCFVRCLWGNIAAHDRFLNADGQRRGFGAAKEERISMALNDDDITTSGAGGEGPADGGSNPEGNDGGADGTAGGEGPADGGSNPEGNDGGADGSA